MNKQGIYTWVLKAKETDTHSHKPHRFSQCQHNDTFDLCHVYATHYDISLIQLAVMPTLAPPVLVTFDLKWSGIGRADTFTISTYR